MPPFSRRLLLFGLFLSLSASPLAAQQPVNRLWSEHCARCHGNRGEGGSAVSLVEAWDRGPEADRRDFEAIRDGVAGTEMPDFGRTLSRAEIWGLVVHLREFQEAARKAQTAPRQPNAEGRIESDHLDLRVETVARGGLSTPWSIALLPEGGWWLAERSGRLRRYDGERLGEPVAGTPEVAHLGQGGLLGIAVHPAYRENGWLYLSYTHARGGRYMTRVVRGRVEANRWMDEEVIFEAPPQTYRRTRRHFGCRLVFDEAGHLYFSIGDRGRRPEAQRLDLPNGKVHRLRDDGRVPEENPFAGEDGALPSIWSYGLRNPQGMQYDPESGTLWVSSHGPRGGDELNAIVRGGNYGWPEVSYGIHYNLMPLATPWAEAGEAMIPPVYRWLPSIAVSGMTQVRGPAFPAWEGDLLVGGLAGEVLERLRVEGGEVVERERLFEGIGRVRDVATAPDGTVYVLMNGPDRVLRLLPE